MDAAKRHAELEIILIRGPNEAAAEEASALWYEMSKEERRQAEARVLRLMYGGHLSDGGTV